MLDVGWNERVPAIETATDSAGLDLFAMMAAMTVRRLKQVFVEVHSKIVNILSNVRNQVLLWQACKAH